MSCDLTSGRLLDECLVGRAGIKTLFYTKLADWQTIPPGDITESGGEITALGATAVNVYRFEMADNVGLFDMAVNAGKKNAVKLLQELLFGCDNDGAIGPITAQSIANAAITTDLVAAYIAKRIEYYYKVSKRRNNAKFLKGWIKRVYNTKLEDHA